MSDPAATSAPTPEESRSKTERYATPPTLHRDTGFRRFSDRLLYGACSATILLVGTVWGITWHGTETRVDKHEGRIGDVERSGSQTSERVRVLETQLPLLKEQVQEMRIEQRAMSNKLDQLLIEIKKR